MLGTREIKEGIIPIKWSEWDECDRLCNIYYNVTFLENFGIFKKDDKYSSICLDYANGIIQAYNEDGSKIIKSQNFVAMPVLNICNEK